MDNSARSPLDSERPVMLNLHDVARAVLLRTGLRMYGRLALPSYTISVDTIIRYHQRQTIQFRVFLI